MEPAPAPCQDGLAAAGHEPLPAPALYEQARQHLATQREFWVFAYGSLLWRPEFEADRACIARVWGHHRALRMYSRVNRGTPEQPGLVFALLPGGCCQGQILRVPRARHEAVLQALWAREMIMGIYTPRWLQAQGPQGPVRALAFTLPRHSPAHTGHLSEAQLLHILRHARGRYGRTLDYLVQTARRLHELRIRDADVERLMRLAHRHRLLGA